MKRNKRNQLKLRLPMAKRPIGTTTVTRIDLGPGYGVFDIPTEVANYIGELAQENYSIQTRVAKTVATAKGWDRRPIPKVLSISKGYPYNGA